MNETTGGHDPCIAKLIEKCLDVLRESVTKMVNLSLRHGLFIQDWKLAIVKPLIKTPI